jgi:hypothetical protein
MPIVVARLARRKPRSSSRWASVRRAAGYYGEMRELADIGAPTFETSDDLGRVKKSGSRSAQAVESTKNRM